MAARYASKSRIETIGDFLTAIEKGTSLKTVAIFARAIAQMADEEDAERRAAGVIGVGLMVSQADFFPPEKRISKPCRN